MSDFVTAAPGCVFLTFYFDPSSECRDEGRMTRHPVIAWEIQDGVGEPVVAACGGEIYWPIGTVHWDYLQTPSGEVFAIESQESFRSYESWKEWVHQRVWDIRKSAAAKAA